MVLAAVVELLVVELLVVGRGYRAGEEEEVEDMIIGVGKLVCWMEDVGGRALFFSKSISDLPPSILFLMG